MRRGGDIAQRLQTNSGSYLHYIMPLHFYKDKDCTLVCPCVFYLLIIKYGYLAYEDYFIRNCGRGQGINTLVNFFVYVPINVL